MDIYRRVQGARWRFETETEVLLSARETGYGGRREFIVHPSRVDLSESFEGDVVSSANLRRVRWPAAEVDEAVSVVQKRAGAEASSREGGVASAKTALSEMLGRCAAAIAVDCASAKATRVNNASEIDATTANNKTPATSVVRFVGHRRACIDPILHSRDR